MLGAALALTVCSIQWAAADQAAESAVILAVDQAWLGNLGWASGTYSAKDKAGKMVETGKYLSVSVKKDGHCSQIARLLLWVRIPSSTSAPARVPRERVLHRR